MYDQRHSLRFLKSPKRLYYSLRSHCWVSKQATHLCSRASTVMSQVSFEFAWPQTSTILSSAQSFQLTSHAIQLEDPPSNSPNAKNLPPPTKIMPSPSPTEGSLHPRWLGCVCRNPGWYHGLFIFQFLESSGVRWPGFL